MKFALVVPWSSPFMFTDFWDGNANMRCPEGHEMRWFRGKGWCPARRHADGCEQALNWGADFICILGADQMHPEDTVIRLYERFKQGHEVVAALVPCRGFIGWYPMKPFQPMAWRFKANEPGDMSYKTYLGIKRTGDMVEVVKPQDGEIQRVDFIGSGVLMFHRDHLLALAKPWFYETINPENMQRIASMDTTFCYRLQKEAGATIWVDTTIGVKHLHVFKVDETFQDRFDDWAEAGKGDSTVCMIPDLKATMPMAAPQSAIEEAIA